ncbi:MAG: ABC transporter permease [Desulfobacterales bacterium]|nr:MAG: ABC transporter permease [Desulfobacterales bacterium]
MDFQLILESLPKLLNGTLLTLKLVALSMVFGMILAIPLALMRVSQPLWLRGPAYGYIFFFRGTPLLVQIFLVYYGFSQFAAIRESILWPILREPYWCSIIAFTLNTSAYTGEVLRGAIRAVPSGQIEAGLSVGMSRFLLLRRIVGPQAARLALPGYGNEVILLIKSSSLASTVTLLEITGVARNIIADTFMPIELFSLAAAIYLSMIFIITRIFMVIEYWLMAPMRPPKDIEQVDDDKLAAAV